MKQCMSWSLFLIANIILHSHLAPSFKRPQSTSLYTNVPIKRAGPAEWLVLALLLQASSSSAPLECEEGKNGQERRLVGQTKRQGQKERSDRARKKETGTERERHRVRGINRDRLIDTQTGTENLAEQVTDRQTTRLVHDSLSPSQCQGRMVPKHFLPLKPHFLCSPATVPRPTRPSPEQ